MTRAERQESAAREKIGAKLRALREKLNCTQDDLAKTLNLNRGYISQIEVGYSGIALQRATDTVRAAYSQFGEQFEEPSMQQIQLPITVSAPGEVDFSNVPPEYTESAVAKRVQAFQQEFALRPKQLADLFGLSSGHEYVIRTGRHGSSLYARKNTLSVIDRETEIRRANRATARPRGPSTTPITPAPTQSDVAVPAVLVKDAASLLATLACDFATRHRFQKLPDGSYLVVKER